MGTGSISFSGIDTAITNLNYSNNSIKHRVVTAIRNRYTDERSLSGLTAIAMDDLIPDIWETGNDIVLIQKKRRNFSSIKSSINSDLKQLSPKNQNPENITLTPGNVFDMTDEAKNNLLNSFTDAVRTEDMDLNQVVDILKTITTFLADMEKKTGDDAPHPDLIETIKKMLEKMAGEFDSFEAVEDDLETVEIDPDDQIQDMADDLETVEIDPDDQIQDMADDLETVEIDPDDQIQDMADDLETVEIDPDDQIQDMADDLETVEIDPDDQIQDMADDLETVEIDANDRIEALNEQEVEALEAFRQDKALAEQFDNALSQRDKKYNAYVEIPAGTYTVGADVNAPTGRERRQIEMPGAFIARYPVTNALFEVFVEHTGYVTTAEKKGTGTVYQGRFKTGKGAALWKKNVGSVITRGACWYQPHGPGSSLHGKRNHPVVQVSLDDAAAFAAWIGRRLPSEAEWEAAAGTDMGLRYPWGNQWTPNACNIEQNSVADTTPVDSHDAHANEFTIADLIGNAMEWVTDQETMETDTGEAVTFNIAKGGGWTAKPDLTVSSRALFRPNFTSNTIGFRCISEKRL